MRPGLYLRKRREAAGLSLGEARARLGMLDLSSPLWKLESGAAELTLRDIARLRAAFVFDVHVARRLLEEDESDRICRRCACTEHDACPDRIDGGCHWAEHDLCSACIVAPAELAS